MRKGILAAWLILTVAMMVTMFTPLNVLARILAIALGALNIYTVVANFRLANELDKIGITKWDATVSEDEAQR